MAAETNDCIRCKTTHMIGSTDEIKIPWTRSLESVKDLKKELYRLWPSLIHGTEENDEDINDEEGDNRDDSDDSDIDDLPILLGHGQIERRSRRLERSLGNIAILYFGKILKDNDRLSRLRELRRNLEDEFLVCVRKGQSCYSHPPSQDMSFSHDISPFLSVGTTSLMMAEGASSLAMATGGVHEDDDSIPSLEAADSDEAGCETNDGLSFISQVLGMASCAPAEEESGGGGNLARFMSMGARLGSVGFLSCDRDDHNDGSLGSLRTLELQGAQGAGRSTRRWNSRAGIGHGIESDLVDDAGLIGAQLSSTVRMAGAHGGNRRCTSHEICDGSGGGGRGGGGASDSDSGAESACWTFCSRCGADHPEWQCSLCNQAAYCSRECQQSHWTTHKVACKLNREHENLS
mmetsp:Transcript_66040/g.129505  ORF Transcript_66040/g.129505 Transcript_66040/m.129505 type:complete len:405 (+) Transcript_66040:87-1301(+)